MEQHRDTFSSGQSLVKMDTVADGLASLCFHQGKREEEKREREENTSKGEEESIQYQ